VSSPWTKSLADQLRTVVEGGCEHDNKFFRALGRRLDKAGPQLLHQVNKIRIIPGKRLLTLTP